MPSTSLSEKFKRATACALVLAASAAFAYSQTGAGSIKGSVTDEQGGLVVGASITVRDARGAERSAATNDAGAFEFKSLAPGLYTLRAVAPGFAAFEQKQVEVRAGRATTLEVQLGVTLAQESVTVDDRGVSTDADRNADAVVLRGRELEALPSDPQALASALQAMAGPPTGEQGGGGGAAQVTVDGFSNGQVPPKESIREVRINNNPYSAENEYPGWGGIEIYTQPGSDKWHAGGGYEFNDESLNSRNPFAPRRAPYQQRNFSFYASGPLRPKRASFYFNAGRYATDLNSVVNATVLDEATLLPVVFNRSFVTPQTSPYMTARGDLKINKKHTLVGNYRYARNTQDLQGIGGFALPSRAFRGLNTYQTLQLTETALLNERTVNETRFQFSRNRSRQLGDNSTPALNVLDAFFGGGSQIGASSNEQQRAELQNFTSLVFGNHFLKVGGRVRDARIRSVSQGNFGGTYTFAGGLAPRLDASDQIVLGAGGQPELTQISSLERYRRTLLFARRGLTPTQIRALGGGATQFSLAGGDPAAGVSQTDLSLYVQDEWKLRPDLTVSPGLRYENQTNVSSDLNFAPRIAFAWAPVFGRKKPATPAPAANSAASSPTPNANKTAASSPSANGAASSSNNSASSSSKPAASTSTAAASAQGAKAAPAAQAATTAQAATAAPKPAAPPAQAKTVFRGGIGLFYNRISEDLTLQARRFNGVTQQQFVVTDPSVLDLFPTVPALSQLNAFSVPQTRRLVSPLLDPAVSLRASFSVERQLPHGIKASFTFGHNRTLHTLRTVNINAPLAGTRDPNNPASGTRPLGASAGNVLEYESNGHAVSNSLSVSVNGRVRKASFWASYSHNKSSNTDGGTSGSPFDPYDFSGEWGRSSFDIRHFFYFGGNYAAPHDWSFNLFVVANSGTPFNITTGRDTNGDNSFSERPAFADDLSKPGVVLTPYGALDPNPTPGQRIIPRNFAQGPGFVSFNVGAEKVFKFGRAVAPKSAPAVSSGNAVTSATSPQPPPKKQPVQRPYQVALSLYASNLLNRNNRSNPVGNMASPFFLRSTSGSGLFIFGPGGGGAGGNRQIVLRLRLSF